MARRKFVIAMMMHETNTFSPVPTPLASFRPLAGQAAIEEFRDTNTQLGGLLDVVKEAGGEAIVPLAAGAHPSGHVEKAGADVLMAPGLPDLEAVRAVCAAVSKPVNFMAGIKGRSFTVTALEAAGVRRISLATSLYRAAMTGLLDAAREVKDKGTFGYLDHSLATPDLNAFMEG